jgi:cysteine desulfurase
MIKQLNTNIPKVHFNGNCEKNCLYTVLSVRFPAIENAEMLLFNLDIAGIAASGGSACTSGSDKGSHVLQAIGVDVTCPSIRFSFSKYNKIEEIDYTVTKLKELFTVKKEVA